VCLSHDPEIQPLLLFGKHRQLLVDWASRDIRAASLAYELG